MITGNFNRKDRSVCDRPEEIENYHEAISDPNETWICHHRIEICPDGVSLSQEWLKENGLYYHQPPEALIFLKMKDHMELHHKYQRYNRGKKHPGIKVKPLDYPYKTVKCQKMVKEFKEYQQNGGELSWVEFNRRKRGLVK